MKTFTIRGRSIKKPDIIVNEENERELSSLLEKYLHQNVGLLRREATGLAYQEGIIIRLADSKIGIRYYDKSSPSIRESPFQKGDRIYLTKKEDLLPGQSLPIKPHMGFV
jgi:hypothetical protein